MTNLSKALILSITIVVLGFTIGLTGNWLYHQIPEYTCYEGKEIFITEQDYINFKEYIAQKSIIIDEVHALSSEPPIIVDFKLRIPEEYDMPYQYDIQYITPVGGYQQGAVAIWGGGSITALILVMIIAFVLWKDEK